MKKKDLYLSFIEEHSFDFDSFVREFLVSYADYLDDPQTILPGEVCQILDLIGCLPENLDIFTGFCNLIKEKFDLTGKKITEVGGGIYPSVGRRLSGFSNVKHVIVYDRALGRSVSNSDKLQLIRGPLPEEGKCLPCDLFVGLRPCSGGLSLVERAIETKTDFIVALCEGGAHGEGFDFYENEDEWLDTVIYLAEKGVKKQNMGELVIEKSLLKYRHDYPVIFNQR